MIKKTICQKILENLKVRQDRKNSKSKKVKEDVLSSATALLKGRKMVLKAFGSGIYLKPEELKQ